MHPKILADRIRSQGTILLLTGCLLILLGSTLLGLILISSIDGPDPVKLSFELWLNEKRQVFKGVGQGPSVDITGDPVLSPGPTRFGGGILDWKQDLAPEGAGYVSSPTLVNLDNDGFLEVVVACSNDAVYALNSDGSFHWEAPYTDDIIDCLGETAGTSGLDFEPPRLLTSVVASDVLGGNGTEIFLGVKNGGLCLGNDGSKLWKKGMTTGYYISPPTITDLEGEYNGSKEHLEVVFTSEDEGRRGWLEAYEPDGDPVFREEAVSGGEGGVIGCSVVAHDLDGDFWDGPELIDPDPTKERDTELILGNHDRGLRIWERWVKGAGGVPNYEELNIGMTGGHQTYATSAVANVTGGPDCEIFVGCSEGYTAAWNGWGGKLYVYTPSGLRLWDYNTGSSGASIFSSPAVADIHCSADDPSEEHIEYEVMFGSDNGRLYVLNTEYHSLLWTFDTGGKVLSSPAVCNIDHDDELEIIVGSDSGKVFCFDGDPSDGVNEGVAYPGDGTGHDVLWVYDVHKPIGCSSPAVADIDLDGQLEVLIGDMDGQLHCISAGGMTVRGQVDWPTFHCNVNRTGFYNPQRSYWVDVHPKVFEDGTIETLVRSMRPGEEATIDLTVRSMDSELYVADKQTIEVGIDGRSIPSGWSAWLDTPPDKGVDDPEYLRLGPGESADMVLHLTAPREGRLVRFARINVSCWSAIDRWVSDGLTVIALMNLSLDYELRFDKVPSSDVLDPHYGSKWETIGPGSFQVVGARLSNIGNLNATYILALNGPPKEAGWDWYFAQNGNLSMEVQLTTSELVSAYGGSSVLPLNIRVEVPAGAPEGQVTKIRLMGLARPANASGIDERLEEDEIFVIVSEQSEIRLSTDGTHRAARPNLTVEHLVHITNSGNKDSIGVILTHGPIPSGWTMALPREPITVYMGQTKAVVVKVTPPSKAIAGEKQVIQVTGTIVDDTRYFDKVSLTTVVEQVYDINAVLLEREGLTLLPGSSASFSMALSNLGNGPDQVEIAGICPAGWTVDLFDVEGAQRSTYFLDRECEPVIVRGKLTVPLLVRSGWYQVGLNVSGGGSGSMPILRVFVEQTYDLNLTTMDGGEGATVPIGPDQRKDLMLMVTNRGNGLDKVVLTLEEALGVTGEVEGDTYEGWTSAFTSVSNCPEFLTSVKAIDLRDPVLIRGEGPEVLYAHDPGHDTDEAVSGTELRDLYLLMESGAIAYVRLSIKAPYHVTEPGSYPFNVTARGMGGAVDREAVSFTMELGFPNIQFIGGLGITGGKGSGRAIAESGQIVTFQVTIRNTGVVAAENVEVSFYVDGIRKRTFTIRSLRPMGEEGEGPKTASFSWMAEEGDHRIMVLIDPEESIIEPVEGEGLDNIMSRTVKVSGDSYFNDLVARNPVVTAVLIIILAVIVLVAFAIVLNKRRSRGGV